MRTLYQKFETLLQSTTTDFKRYLYEKVSWNNRMIGIIGARGVGKTTMIIQYISGNLDSKKHYMYWQTICTLVKTDFLI